MRLCFKRRQLAKQIKEDFDLAKQVALLDSVASKSPTAASVVQIDAPCSSKTATKIESLQKEDMDDREIALLLQAEFDLEYDEELKRLENARNKSNKILFINNKLFIINFRLKGFCISGKVSNLS
jgi:hypothetical protein